jgi:Polyketide cyclase / dehydrase and lipid transport
MTYTVRPIEVSAHVDADPDRLFAFVSDSRNDPKWCFNVESVDLTHGNGVEVGARFRFHQHLDPPAGKRMQFDAELEIVGLEERAIRWLVTDRFQEREISLSVEPDGTGSRITQGTRATFLKSPGLARFVYPSLARRTFRGQFQALGDLMAAEGASGPDGELPRE